MEFEIGADSTDKSQPFEIKMEADSNDVHMMTSKELVCLLFSVAVLSALICLYGVINVLIIDVQILVFLQFASKLHIDKCFYSPH